MKQIATLSGIAMIVVAMTVGLDYAEDETDNGQKIVDDMTQVFEHLNADPNMG